MDNHVYNIIKALTEKADALWVYDHNMEESEGCSECEEIWKKLKKDDSTHLEMLKKVISSHFREGATWSQL